MSSKGNPEEGEALCSKTTKRPLPPLETPQFSIFIPAVMVCSLDGAGCSEI